LDGEPIAHEVEGGQILTDEAGPLKIRYIKRLTQISQWRPLMARVFAARLAVYAATRVTGKMQYYQKAMDEYQRLMIEAQHADSLERGTTERTSVPGGYTQDVFTVRGITSR